MREYMILAALHAKGNYKRLKEMIETPRFLSSIDYFGKALVMGDALYPERLYDLEEPPLVLFYEGDLRLLHQGPMVSVIGSRLPSNYALEMTQSLVEKLKHQHVIVSGLARGIDTQAHRASLDFNTVAVLGCGIDVYYPRENKVYQDEIRRNHLLLSEYPPGTPPQKYHFPFRNRIIAALCTDLYVMAATHQSGTMKTVDEAMKINRNVTCLPHCVSDPSGQGCNLLIKDGAGILTEHDF